MSVSICNSILLVYSAHGQCGHCGGVETALLRHPAQSACLTNKPSQRNTILTAGEFILTGLFARPMRKRGETIHANYGPRGHHVPLHVNLDPTFRHALNAAERPLVGMWICSGSPTVAEICAGSGLDWLLIDAEHSPNGLEAILAQVQAVHGYPVTPLVRPPSGDALIIKRYLDLGVQNLLVPMVDTAEQAAAVVRATAYPPEGVRGVGSALARTSRWNRIPDYLQHARDTMSLYVQVESAKAVLNVEAITATDGVDGIFVGPADLAASMGFLGQQDHPDVVDAVLRSIDVANAGGVKVGVNAFDPTLARRYLDAGADFILVGADVQLLARGSTALAAEHIEDAR